MTTRSPKRGSVAYVERRLREAVEAARASGVVVASGTFYVLADVFARPPRLVRCCVIGAVVPPDNRSGPVARAAAELGITEQAVWDIVCGFDDLRGFGGTRWHRLGNKLAAEFLPEASR
jgi:hypothetical protein